MDERIGGNRQSRIVDPDSITVSVEQVAVDRSRRANWLVDAVVISGDLVPRDVHVGCTRESGDAEGYVNDGVRIDSGSVDDRILDGVIGTFDQHRTLSGIVDRRAGDLESGNDNV